MLQKPYRPSYQFIISSCEDTVISTTYPRTVKTFSLNNLSCWENCFLNKPDNKRSSRSQQLILVMPVQLDAASKSKCIASKMFFPNRDRVTFFNSCSTSCICTLRSATGAFAYSCFLLSLLFQSSSPLFFSKANLQGKACQL